MYISIAVIYNIIENVYKYSSHPFKLFSPALSGPVHFCSQCGIWIWVQVSIQDWEPVGQYLALFPPRQSPPKLQLRGLEFLPLNASPETPSQQGKVHTHGT